MTASRLRAVFLSDSVYNWKRPFFWIWLVLLFFNAFLLSTGEWIIRSVDTSVGTQKSFVNSEFQISFAFSLMSVLFVGLFSSIAAGTTVIRDAQQRVGEIIHATPLTPREYIWGKYLAALAGVLATSAVFVFALILLNEIIPNPAAADIHGPFRLRNYLMPFLMFLTPAIVFFSGISFAIAEFSRKVFLVYLFPVVALLFVMNFLYSWYPPDAGAGLTLFLQSIDPGGFRWLKQTWLIVDRGVGFYNVQPIIYSAGFLAGRAGFILIGLFAVALSSRNFAQKHARTPDRKGKAKVQPATAATPALSYLDTAGDTVPAQRRTPGILQQIRTITLFELKEMTAQPWLYLFIVIISILLVSADRSGIGNFHLDRIYTSGLMAVSRMGPLTMLVCFLLLFTNAESLHREVLTRFGPLSYSTPISTAAWILGKAISNFFVAALATAAGFLTIVAFITMQGEAPVELLPFFYTWGGCMLPTFFFWTGFVMAAYSLTGSRMATYGISIGLMIVTGWLSFNQMMTWVMNWALFDNLIWSEFGVFEIDRVAIVLNRLLYTSLGASLLAVAVLRFPRRSPDPQRAPVRKASRRRLAFLCAAVILPPAILATTLWIQVEAGFQGKAAKNAAKDYWRHNVGTPWNELLPHRTSIDIDVRFDPPNRAFTLHGSYELINRMESPLYRIPVTAVGKWNNLRWTLNGKDIKPENRSGLYVFAMDPPLQPQEKVALGFSYDGVLLPGISKNGGQLDLGEFVLPSGITLTGRNPWFVPVVGYVDSIGIDEENSHEPEDPGPRYYEGITPGGIDRSLLNTRIRIDVPQEYFATSMGVLRQEKQESGRRILLWESDYPVRVFNIVAGKWTAMQGKSATIYHHPRHTYNLKSMMNAMESGRQYYSEWFGPYPWKDLRMSEFPGLSDYARGNPTNIFFSESIGFLTKDLMDQPGAFGIDAFGITAHETAHQWWGHIVSPGEGPGALALAEGMAHFSVMCLLEQVGGKQARQNFNRQIESFYGENRSVSSERPLLRTGGNREADSTVIYDKGGWVFWMMRNLLGKDRMYEGLRSFRDTWHSSLDQPVLEDFIAHMRNFAPDPVAYDSFTRQWFQEVVMPEYRYLSRPEKKQTGGVWEVRTRVKNVGNATMPVDVAAGRGVRDSKLKAYLDYRINITLAPDQEYDLLLQCDFEPEWVTVDPDVQVFQLQRNGASYRWK